MKAVTHLEKVIAGEVSAETHLEKVIANEATAVTYTEKVIAGEATPITHLEKVIAGEASPVSHLEYVWAGRTPEPTEHEYTGTVPTPITANGEPLIAWSIYGNMQQTGTPTPDSPIYPSETGDRTENLLNKNGEILVGNGAFINILATGVKTVIETAGSNRYSSIKLNNKLLGKTITISSTITQSANNKGQIRLFYVNGRYATSSITAITTAGQTGYITSTYTMPSSIPSGSDGIAIVLSADRSGDGNIGDYVEYADLMIVEGSTAPSSYIPNGYKLPVQCGGVTTPVYTAEPLRKIGDYTDYKSNSAEYRAVKKYEFTGQETAYEYDVNNGIYRFRLSELSIERLSNTDIIVSHFSKAISTAEIQDGQYSIGTNYIYLRITSITSGSDFTTYLQQQYAAGTPVCVWYVLATPTTESISAPEIPTTAGSQTFDVDTTLKPSEVYIKYKG